MSACATTAWRSCSPVGRSSTGRTHSKLRGLVRKDLFGFQTSSEDLKGYDACFFCLGVSSVGMSGADYTRLAYDRTLGSAQVLARTNPGMTFVYVSGTGTGGKAMWAQVKGRTECALLLFSQTHTCSAWPYYSLYTARSQGRSGRGSATPSFARFYR